MPYDFVFQAHLQKVVFNRTVNDTVLWCSKGVLVAFNAIATDSKGSHLPYACKKLVSIWIASKGLLLLSWPWSVGAAGVTFEGLVSCHCDWPFIVSVRRTDSVLASAKGWGPRRGQAQGKEGRARAAE